MFHPSITSTTTYWHALLLLSNIFTILLPYFTSSVPPHQWVLLITHLQPPPSGWLLHGGGDTHTRKDKWGRGVELVVGWVRHITIIDPWAGANWLSPVCLCCTIPCVLLPQHGDTHMNSFECISAGIMKCVIYNQGAASTCQMSRLLLSSFSLKPLSTFLSVSLFIFFKVFCTPSGFKRQEEHRANHDLPQWLTASEMSEGQLVWRYLNHTTHAHTLFTCHIPCIHHSLPFTPSPSSKESF